MSRLISRLDPTAIRFDLLAPGTPLAAGSLPGGGTYTQAAGSNQAEETVQTSASTVARWAFVANLPRIGLLADGGIGLVLEPPRTNLNRASDALNNGTFWSVDAGVTVTAAYVTSPAAGFTAVRVQTPSAAFGITNAGSPTSALGLTHSAWARSAIGAGAQVSKSVVGNPLVAVQINTTETWARWSLYTASVANPGQGHTVADGRATTGPPVAAARDQVAWGVQVEVGKYATNLIPSPASAVDVARAGFRSTAPISRYVRGGAFRAVLTTVPHGAATEYDGDSATVRLWTIDASTYAEINTTTRVLTVSVNGVARVAGVPLWWLRGHRVQWSWEVGAGNLRVRYRYSTDQGATWTLPFDPFGGTVYVDSAISTASSVVDLYSDSGSSKWFGTGVTSEEAILTAPAWALRALPTDIGSVRAWMKADRGYQLSAGLVSAWNDQTSFANNVTQGVAANQPTWAASGLDGRPYLSFDGSNDHLSFGADIDATARDWLFAFVAQSTASGGSTTFFDCYDGVNPRIVLTQSGWATPGKTSWYDGGSWNEPANETLSPVLHVWDLRAGASVAGYFRNGTLTGANATYTQRAIKIASGGKIAAAFNASSNFAGRIYEWVLLRSHSAADRDALHSYFRAEYPTLAVA